MKDMDMLKEELMLQARKDGICLEGYETMRSCDRDQLIDYYVTNPDWCMERDFPDLHTLTTSFANIQHKGVYVNQVFHGELLNDLQALIFHNCKGVIKTSLNLGLKIIPMFYFANNCEITIECMEDIHIPIYIFGNNDVTTCGNANFKIFNREVFTGGDAPRR